MKKDDPITYQNFVVYPEYCERTLVELAQASKDGKYHVASLPLDGGNCIVVYHNNKFVFKRMKCKLHSSEKNRELIEGKIKPMTVELDSMNVLILICYEIIFPEDYLLQNIDKVDLVIHVVGTPMFDEDQQEGWTALQKSLSLIYSCPVVCCCGGEKGKMNITGVIKGGKQCLNTEY